MVDSEYEKHIGTTDTRLRCCPRRPHASTPVDSIRSRRTRIWNPIRKPQLNLVDGYLYRPKRSNSSQMGRCCEGTGGPKLHVQRGRFRQSSNGIRNRTNNGGDATSLPQVAAVDARIRRRNINTGPGSSEKEHYGVKAIEVGGSSPSPGTIPPAPFLLPEKHQMVQMHRTEIR